MTVTVSSRGQLVIPAKIRRRYRISSQAKIECLDLGSEIVLVPIPKDAFRASRGILKGLSTADLLAARRKERLREHGRPH